MQNLMPLSGRAGANPDKAAGEWLRHHEMKFEWDEPHQLGLSVAKLDRPSGSSDSSWKSECL